MNEFKDVRQIKEMNQHEYLTRRNINEFLKEGWVLLYVFSEMYQTGEGPSQKARYVLGWTKEDEPS